MLAKAIANEVNSLSLSADNAVNYTFFNVSSGSLLGAYVTCILDNISLTEN